MSSQAEKYTLLVTAQSLLAEPGCSAEGAMFFLVS